MKRKIELYSTFSFANKGLDAINLGNILHHTYVRAMFHLISKINLFLSFYIPILHSLHQNPLIIDVHSVHVFVVVSVLLIILVFWRFLFLFFFYVLCLVPNVSCIYGLSLGYSVRFINAVSL